MVPKFLLLLVNHQLRAVSEKDLHRLVLQLERCTVLALQHVSDFWRFLVYIFRVLLER